MPQSKTEARYSNPSLRMTRRRPPSSTQSTVCRRFWVSQPALFGSSARQAWSHSGARHMGAISLTGVTSRSFASLTSSGASTSGLATSANTLRPPIENPPCTSKPSSSLGAPAQTLTRRTVGQHVRLPSTKCSHLPMPCMIPWSNAMFWALTTNQDTHSIHCERKQYV